MGAKTPAQLSDNLGATRLVLDADDLKALDDGQRPAGRIPGLDAGAPGRTPVEATAARSISASAPDRQHAGMFSDTPARRAAPALVYA